MAKRLQLRRGTTVEHSTFTGALGEVTVDIDKDVIVIHDAVTVGGHPLAKDIDKQDTLVSGTTIKTVNSTSLLGSGDVAVQETLVSGTNIKTVGGTTLLGAGDIAIADPSAISFSAAHDDIDYVVNSVNLAIPWFVDTNYGSFTTSGVYNEFIDIPENGKYLIIVNLLAANPYGVSIEYAEVALYKNATKLRQQAAHVEGGGIEYASLNMSYVVDATAGDTIWLATTANWGSTDLKIIANESGNKYSSIEIVKIGE